MDKKTTRFSTKIVKKIAIFLTSYFVRKMKKSKQNKEDFVNV